MREAVIVSTARTPIGKAYRGAFNNTHGAVLGAHAIKHAIEKANTSFQSRYDDVLLPSTLINKLPLSFDIQAWC